MDKFALFFQDGGAFMLPIAFILVVGLAIAIERLLYLVHCHRRNRSLLKELSPAFQHRDYRALDAKSAESTSAVGRMIQATIQLLQRSTDREALANLLEEKILEATPAIEKRTHYLATLANVATLLGLLGTIMGLIDAFTSLGGAEASERAALLSSSISVAMNTTAFGLMTAIPLLLVHTFLQSKTNQIVDTLDMSEAKCLALMNQDQI